MTFPPSHEDIIELALPDGDLLHSDDTDVYTSKLGGRPVWLTAPSKDLIDSLKCPRCKTELFLLLQMDCPREEFPSVDRVVYIFVCNSRPCSQDQSGWRVIFMMKHKEGEPSKVPDAKTKASSFWDSLMGDGEDEKEKETEKDELVVVVTDIPISNPKNRFPGIYLHIDEEIIVEKREKRQTAVLPEDINTTTTTPEEEWSGEQYEKVRAPGTDKSFSRFQKRVNYYPRQCVRYAVSGAQIPLLYHDLDIPSEIAKFSTCERCNSKCSRFELQLMPAILAFLPTESPEHIKHISASKRSSNPMISDGMEWGSVLVYSCGALCGVADKEAKIVEGRVIIQLELTQ